MSDISVYYTLWLGCLSCLCRKVLDHLCVCVCVCCVCVCVFWYCIYYGILCLTSCCIIIDTWKETVEGEPSYSGTTVACALFKFDRVHIANVGDFKIVLATRNPNYGDFNEPEILARELSKTHRPDDVEEK